VALTPTSGCKRSAWWSSFPVPDFIPSKKTSAGWQDIVKADSGPASVLAHRQAGTGQDSGVVTLASPNGPTYVRDPSGGMMVQSHKLSAAGWGWLTSSVSVSG
jgi:hypothetical protein